MQRLVAMVVGASCVVGCSVDRTGLNPDASLPDASVDASETCSTPSDCNDGFACTSDDCVDGRCTHSPDDSECTGAAVCDRDRGCVGGCEQGETCVPVGCERAVCEGDRCVRTDACEGGEFCCNGDCCGEDGNPCTTAECTADGCEQVPNDGAPCDDGVFCNGADQCMDGSCSVHDMVDPCEGSLTCDPTKDTCVGCVEDDDCPDPIHGPWDTCGGFSGTCDENGTRDRTVTSFTCNDDTCEMQTTTETGNCTRDTDGRGCSDGMFCNGEDQCSGGSCSSHAGDPCPPGTNPDADMCDEGSSTCIECMSDGHCPDDGNPCTNNTCSGGGACVTTNVADGTPCNDGVFCNGSETCSGGTCGSPGDPCAGMDPTNVCDEAGDRCVECLDDGDCPDVCDTGSNTCVECTSDGECPDDGNFCNGDEVCNSNTCEPEGDPCSGMSPTDVCDEGGDRCVECLDDGDCPDACDTSSGVCVECTSNGDCPDDGEFCNGDEVCNSNTCESEGDPCIGMSPTDVCDESGARCVECLDDEDCPDACDTDSNTCVQCTGDGDCDGDDVCDTDSNTCVQCTGDGDCDGDDVCCSGSCQECCTLDDCSNCTGGDCGGCGGSECSKMCDGGSCACACM